MRVASRAFRGMKNGDFAEIWAARVMGEPRYAFRRREMGTTLVSNGKTDAVGGIDCVPRRAFL